MFDADRLEQRFDRELVVRLAGYRFAHQGGVSRKRAWNTRNRCRVEGELCCSIVAAVSQNVFPGAVVSGAGRFGANS